MIIKYTPVTDEYTTYNLVEPDYMMDDSVRCTRLCELDSEVYVYVPDSLTLPMQYSQITVTEVILTDELKDKIKNESHRIQFINQQVRDKITEQYSIYDEIKVLRKKDKDKIKFDDYDAYVEECCVWGDVEKAKLGI